MSESELYSDLILELYHNPPHKGTLPNPTLTLSGGNPLCGDELNFYLLLKDNRVQDIRFTSQGCAISTASASLVADLVLNKTISEILALTDQDVFHILGNIIQTRIKCALLGLHTLQQGLVQWQKNPHESNIQISLK